MTTVINFKSAQDTESQKNLEFFISTNKKTLYFLTMTGMITFGILQVF